MFSTTTILDPEVLNEIKWSKIIFDKAVVPHQKRLPLTEALFFISCDLELVTLNNYKNSHVDIISYKSASKTGCEMQIQPYHEILYSKDTQLHCIC